MKAILILSDNIYLTPYISVYTEIMNKLNISYDIIFWDKNEVEKLNNYNYYRFFYRSNNKFSKILGYIKFKSFVIKILKNNKYDIVIPLHMPIYLILGRYIIRNYKDRYIFDVRDYSYEKFLYFKKIETKLVNNSMINIISSDGYKKFLPLAQYFNMNNVSMQNYEKYKQYNNSKIPIQISYIGLIRFMEQNKKIINFFKNDSRFHLNFIGTNANNLEEYCKEMNVENVTLIDTFPPQQTLDFYKKTDLIMNLYGNNTPLLEFALSNKLYYSALLYKPILVCNDTYMSNITQKYNLGFTLLLKDKGELDELFSYIINLNRHEYIESCDSFIENVNIENDKTIKEISNRILKIKENVVKKND